MYSDLLDLKQEELESVIEYSLDEKSSFTQSPYDKIQIYNFKGLISAVQ